MELFGIIPDESGKFGIKRPVGIGRPLAYPVELLYSCFDIKATSILPGWKETSILYRNWPSESV